MVLVQTPGRPETLRAWWDSGLLNWLGLLLAAEFALAVLADILGRVVSLIDSLLSERVTNSSSIRLMEHAATLDLEDFENAEFQDQLERARRQTSGRMPLMGQMLGQAQDLVTVASFAAGLVLYAPWLIALEDLPRQVLHKFDNFLWAYFGAKGHSEEMPMWSGKALTLKRRMAHHVPQSPYFTCCHCSSRGRHDCHDP